MHQDGLEDEKPTDPRVTRLMADTAAITPYLSQWLLSGRVGAFVIERDADGVLAVSATVSDAAESQIVPYIVPGN